MNSRGSKNPYTLSRIADSGLNHGLYKPNPPSTCATLKHYLHAREKVGVKLRSSICQVKCWSDPVTDTHWMDGGDKDDYSCEMWNAGLPVDTRPIFGMEHGQN